MFSLLHRYTDQESLPVSFNEGSFHYLEALHKEMYGTDALTVAVTMPNNITYAPIPEEFLWTSYPYLTAGIAVLLCFTLFYIPL